MFCERESPLNYCNPHRDKLERDQKDKNRKEFANKEEIIKNLRKPVISQSQKVGSQ